MALPLTQNEPATDAALPTLADWLSLALHIDLAAECRYRLARRRLQRKAATYLAAGECGTLAQLIVDGEWAKLDKLCEAMEGR